MPSIFFIGTNGQPIDIVTGVISSSQELSDRIKIVATRAQINVPDLNVNKTDSNAPGSSTDSTSVSSRSSEEVVCEGDVCRKVTKPADTPGSSEASGPSESPSESSTSTKALEEKVKIAKELLEKKKKEKEDDEAKVAYDFKLF